DPFALVEAARILCADGFQVFPYTTEDLILGEKLLEAGCKLLMPWGAPIGSGQGLRNIEGLRSMRSWFKDIPLIIDAGIGAPSQAAQAMEMGFDGILLNTAVARAQDPLGMAQAFASAIRAGYDARSAGLIERRDMATASTPIFGMAQFS
ncbi:thiazole synthase, partial [Erwinia amylovora]|nr:thiazole synthase [Erwinia amylovora]